MDAPHSNTPVAKPQVPYDPDRLPATPAEFTPQQEREMGVRDDKGRTIQPTNAVLLIMLGFLGCAAVGVVVVTVLMWLIG
jgi:hypothetical protein